MRDTPRTDAHAARMHAHSKRWDFEYRYEGEISTPWPDGLLSDHDFARALERELAAVTAERDALRQDAERYRWLRTRINYRDVVPPASLGGLWPPTERQWTHISYDMSNDTIDESIEAAMSR